MDVTWAWGSGGRTMHAFELAEDRMRDAISDGTVHTACCGATTTIVARAIGRVEGPNYGRCPSCWRKRHPDRGMFLPPVLAG